MRPDFSLFPKSSLDQWIQNPEFIPIPQPHPWHLPDCSLLMKNNSVYLMFLQVWWVALILHQDRAPVSTMGGTVACQGPPQTVNHSLPPSAGGPPLSASVCWQNGSLSVELAGHQFVNSHGFEGRRVRVGRRNTNPIFQSSGVWCLFHCC
jgi:hypothetical protein